MEDAKEDQSGSPQVTRWVMATPLKGNANLRATIRDNNGRGYSLDVGLRSPDDAVGSTGLHQEQDLVVSGPPGHGDWGKDLRSYSHRLTNLLNASFTPIER